jgi:hypothetical protein
MLKKEYINSKLDLLKKAEPNVKSFTRYDWVLNLQKVGVKKATQLFNDSVSKFKFFIVETGIPSNKYFLKEN